MLTSQKINKVDLQNEAYKAKQEFDNLCLNLRKCFDQMEDRLENYKESIYELQSNIDDLQEGSESEGDYNV
jgi:hypothetical protein